MRRHGFTRSDTETTGTMADRADRLDRGDGNISRRDAKTQGTPNPKKVLTPLIHPGFPPCVSICDYFIAIPFVMPSFVRLSFHTSPQCVPVLLDCPSLLHWEPFHIHLVNKLRQF